MQTTTNDNNNTLLSCSECGVTFNNENSLEPFLTQMYNGLKRPVTLEHPFCVGCFRLFGRMDTYLEKYKMILWLLCGECEEDFSGDDSVRSLQVGKYRKKAKRMRQRAKKKSEVAPGNLNVATGKELMDLIISNGPNDVILGHRLFLKDGSKFNSLTFDHMVPVATIRDDPNAFSIENIQLMSRCLNDVKGHFSDYDLILWLENLIPTCIERYSDL